ncbi:hypothetical protein, partial [Acetobacter tropicalis]|uniref:hypothetical protein n=1 Tax=Acetobacter tropicalis TaxID=104102 RepID=UPI0012E80A3C
MQDTLRIMGAHRPFEPPPLPSREKEQRRRPAPDEEEPPIDPDKEGLPMLLNEACHGLNQMGWTASLRHQCA